MKEYQRLKKRIQDQQRLMDEERERKKPRPNILMEQQALDRLKSYDFWCNDCQEDFKAPCYKTRHRIHGDTIAIYRTKCPNCDNECIRYITHKDEDLYYQKSAKIRSQRNQYTLDLLQANQYGFKTHYGDPEEEYIKKLQEKERIIIEGQTGLRGLSLEQQERLERLRE